MVGLDHSFPTNLQLDGQIVIVVECVYYLGLIRFFSSTILIYTKNIVCMEIMSL